MWGMTVRGMGVCKISVRLPMNDVVVYAGLDCGIMSQEGRNAYPWHGLLN